MSHSSAPPAPAFSPSPARVRLLQKIHGAGQPLGFALWPALFLGLGLLADHYQRGLPDPDQVRLSFLTHTPPPTEAGNVGLPAHLFLLLLGFGLLLGLASFYANRATLKDYRVVS